MTHQRSKVEKYEEFNKGSNEVGTRTYEPDRHNKCKGKECKSVPCMCLGHKAAPQEPEADRESRRSPSSAAPKSTDDPRLHISMTTVCPPQQNREGGPRCVF